MSPAERTRGSPFPSVEAVFDDTPKGRSECDRWVMLALSDGARS